MLAGSEGGGKLRSVIPFAALDLDEFFGELPISAMRSAQALGSVRKMADLARFLSACDLTVQWLEQDAQQDYWPEGGAWEHWIRQLTIILREHDLPTGARKDKSGRASPFVSFVFELQSLLPRKLIRSQHSKSALAVSIHKARRGSKPAVTRKIRAR